MDRFNFRHKPSPELFDSLFELLKLSFPADEYRPCDLLKEMLNWPTFSIYAEHDGDHAKALMFSHDLGGMRFIESFCVQPELRGAGYGGHMFDAFIASEPTPVVFEVEPPTDDLTRRRIAFYKRHNMLFDDRNYIMPPLGPGLSPLRLHLMSDAPLGDNFEAVRDAIYRVAYRVEPEDVPSEV